MQPFRIHQGLVAPLDRANVDTDQIIPKQFLKRIERTGFGEFLFYDWRHASATISIAYSACISSNPMSVSCWGDGKYGSYMTAASIRFCCCWRMALPANRCGIMALR